MTTYIITPVGNVLKVNKGKTYSGEIIIGQKKQVKKELKEERIIFQWQVFDLEKGEYYYDPTNNSPIIIDDNYEVEGNKNPKEYIPVNGVVEIMLGVESPPISQSEFNQLLMQQVIDLQIKIDMLGV